jgi:hypothetical protein
VSKWTSFVEHSVKFTIDGLEAQNNYILYVYLINSMGYSKATSYKFKTKKLSYGYNLAIPIKNIVSIEKVIEALSMTLRVP